MPTYDTAKAVKAQREFCTSNAVYNYAEYYTKEKGVCPFCVMNIYSRHGGYSVEYAAANQISGCPFCHKSYVD